MENFDEDHVDFLPPSGRTPIYDIRKNLVGTTTMRPSSVKLILLRPAPRGPDFFEGAMPLVGEARRELMEPSGERPTGSFGCTQATQPTCLILGR